MHLTRKRDKGQRNHVYYPLTEEEEEQDEGPVCRHGIFVEDWTQLQAHEAL